MIYIALKKIFKAGNYGKKGSWTSEDLKKMVEEGKEFSVVPGHVGDWINNGYVKTAIPKGGTVKCAAVDNEGYLYGEINYNEFGNKVTEGGAYDNFSMGFKKNGEPDHLALLGYTPPHLKDLDKAFSEFAGDLENAVDYIEFEEGGTTMGLDEILAALGTLSTEDKLKIAIAVVEGMDATEANLTGLGTLQNKIWDKQDETWYVEKLQSEGYKVAKEFSEDQLREFAEGAGYEIKRLEQREPKTEEQIRKEIKAEFAEGEAKKIKETEKVAFKEKFLKLFPKSLQPMAEFCVDSAYSDSNYENIIEFSEEEKIPMREHLEKMTAEGGPFKELFKNITEGMGGEFAAGSEKVDPYQEGVNQAKKMWG